MTTSKAAPLVVQKLTKTYGRARGVAQLSFSLKEGEVFGFLGPNGAGKTTTIRTILNFLHPSSGSVSIFGLDSVTQSVEAKRHIGYLAGDFAAYLDLTGEQFLHYLGALSSADHADTARYLATRFKAELTRPLKELSKGNRQKIGIIQAFMHKPKLLILDEATSGLDPLMQEEFYSVLREARDDGATIFISSHNLSEVQKVCDRAAFIREGKLVSIEAIAQMQQMSVHRFTVWFGQKVTQKDFEHLKGIEEIVIEGDQGHFVLSGSVDGFIKALAKHKILNIDRQETELEDLFMRYYRGESK